MGQVVGRMWVMGIVLALSVVLVLGAGPVLAKTFTCALNNTDCVGTKKDDTITGEGGNIIHGKAGNDKITSGQSDLLGEKGNDTLKEVAGINDNGVLIGANDLAGGPGDDKILAPFGSSLISGGGGDDDIRAKNGIGDDINCGGGDDTVTFDKGLDDVTKCEEKKS